MRKRDSKQLYKNKADKLFSIYIRKRDGQCLKCKRTDRMLQCAHIITRSNLRLRFDPRNAICMCGGCHMWWHKNPFDATDWFKETFPGDWEYLSKARLEIEKPDYKEVIESLKNLTGKLD